MTAETTFFRDLAYVFGAAVVGGTGARLLRQPLSRHFGRFRHHHPLKWIVNEGVAENRGKLRLGRQRVR
jgi:hypothetical protein